MTETTAQIGTNDEQTRDLRARRIARLRERHWTVLALAVCVIILSLSLEVTDRQRVFLSGFEGLPVPQLCSSRAWLGINCPGCGLTRSFIHLAHGRFAESLATHRVGWVLALVIVLQIPYRIISLRQRPVGGLDVRWPGWISTALIAMLIGNWIAQQLMF